MSQSMTAVQSAPTVDLELDLDQDYDLYDDYGSDDHFDQSSVTAPAAHQHSDTLGASPSDPSSATGLGSHSSPAAVDLLPLRSAQDYASDHDHGEHEYTQSQQPLVSPLPSHSQSHLPPAAGHGTHQEYGQRQQHQAQQTPSPQPYESVPVHAQLHSPRSTRSHSVAASLASIGSQSSIRRKPLSPTASPLAVRFSSRFNQIGHHSPLHDLHYPHPPDSGYYSLDSPDLYDLSPNKPEHTPVSAVVAGNTTSLPAPLEEDSDEDKYVSPSPQLTKP